MCRIVSIFAACTMRDEDRVRRVGAHELGVLERQARLGGVEADDDLDVVALLELLGEAAPPEGAETGDEDAHGSAEPHAAAGAQHVVERDLDLLADPLRLLHHPAARVALLVGFGVEVDRRQHPQLELGRAGR